MALADLLASVAVKPTTDRFPLNYALYEPDGRQSRSALGGRRSGRGENPLVSCLMVTSGERWSIRWSLQCYARQLYAARELVIVTYLDRVSWVQQLVETMGIRDVRVYGVGRELSLGEMRNVSLARSHGEVLIQWDDDDLYDQARITVAVALLTASTGVAAFLWRVLIWWPDREIAAISEERLWEASMAVWRDHAPIYPSLNRLEDTTAMEFLSSTRTVVSCDSPLLYVYIAHGANTCEPEHFEGHLARSPCVLRGADYAELIQMLSERMPIEAYRRRPAIGQS
jgi:hypothetical protein